MWQIKTRRKKNHPIETDPEMTEVMELAYKDAGIPIITTCKYLKKNIA